jgi:hypothetical protein
MGIGASILLIAAGAILRWGVTADVSGISLDTIGLILLIIGILGLVLSLVLWSSVGSWYPGRRVGTRTRVVERRDDYDDRDDLAA